MAVKTYIYGKDETKTEISFEGCVIDTFERNSFEDSDFYAVCWDKESKTIRNVEYDTTRFGGGGDAEIDATPETLREVFDYYKMLETEKFDRYINEYQAKKVNKEDVVEVVRGRKIPKGTVGKVFWIGRRYNSYTRSNEERVGIESEDGTKFFLPLEYVSVVNWEERLICGAEREKKIQKAAIDRMPWYFKEALKCRA